MTAPPLTRGPGRDPDVAGSGLPGSGRAGESGAAGRPCAEPPGGPGPTTLWAVQLERLGGGWLARSQPVRWVPLVLLVFSWATAWAVVDVLVSREAAQWAGLPMGLLVLLRVLVEVTAGRWQPGTPVVLVGYVVHTLLLGAALALNPLACIYAISGFFEVDRFFRGRQLVPAVLVTGLLAAFGQTGGLAGVRAAPLLYLALAAVNVGVSLVMLHASVGRERQVEERERAAEELARAYRENAQLHTALVEQARSAGVAEERARLSREIHDTVAQGLVAVIRQLEALPAGVDDDVRRRVERAEEAARDCLVEARRAVQALAPQQLREGNLAEALAELVRDWARSHRTVTVLDADGAPERFEHAHVLLRVAQEGLSNVARHADASTVRLRLTAGAVESLEISDDGRGFLPDHVERGRGLDGMQERLALAGGRLDVRSAPGRGCTLTAVVPR